MKVTYLLSTSECTSLHNSKWRKEQPFILNHTSCVRMLSKYENKLPAEDKWMHQLTQQQVEKKHSFLITHLVFKCQPNMKVTYQLNTIDWTNSHSRKWRKEQPFICNHTSCVTPNMNVTYHLRTNECTSSHSMQEMEKKAIIHS